MSDKAQFYDPIYKLIVLNDIKTTEMQVFDSQFSSSSKSILQFLNTFELNRLSFLRQSGFVFLAYPSSTHTRFSHSIGSCSVGFKALKAIRIQQEEDGSKEIVEGYKSTIMDLSAWLGQRGWTEEFLLALLLHDIGHFPFSHTLESNLEFWECFNDEEKVNHEDLTCLLIQGPNKGDKEFKDFRKFIQTRLEKNKISDFGCQFVSDLMQKSQGIDKNILCYFISGNDEYRKHLSDHRKYKESKIVHQLVSGLLDLDRMDHYRRDAFFSGIHSGGYINIEGLLEGMLIYYYDNGKEDDFEIRLSPQAISHAKELLSAKEELTSSCFKDKQNLAYDAMLHKAINIYTGVYKLNGDKFSLTQLEKAFLLFFLSDDELLNELMSSGPTEVKKITFRIQNRLPYLYVQKKDINTKRYPNLRKLKKAIATQCGLQQHDIVIRPSKTYGLNKKPTEEWLNLDFLYDENGVNLRNREEHSSFVKHYKDVQELSPNIVWFFAKDKVHKDKIAEGIRKELPDSTE